MEERQGRFGTFWGCTGYPKCRETVKIAGGGFRKEARTGTTPPVEKPYTPSDEQSGIYGAVTAAVAALHWVILALAGTGKTFTLCELARRLWSNGHSVMALAFGRKDADELDAKLNGKCPNGFVAYCQSNNGAGNDILKYHHRGLKMVGDGKNAIALKTMLRTQWINDGLIKFNAGKEEWEGNYDDFQSVVMLVDKARTCLPLKRPMKPTAGQWEELMVRFDVEAVEEGNVLHYCSLLFGMATDLELARKVGIDFGQQIFLPVYHGMKPPKQYDRVLIDETQDQNFGCRALAMMYLKPGTGRIIAVGDSNQAIYSWRGADSSAISVLEKALGTVKHFPLTLCRRCCKAVVRTAQKLVPEIQPLDTAPEGESEIHWPEQEALEQWALEEHNKFKQGKGKRPAALIVCRLNAPIISLCLRFMAQGIGARLMKGDVLVDLARLVDKVSERERGMAIGEFLAKADAWASERLAKLANVRNSESKCALVMDKLSCLNALALGDEVKTVADLHRAIDSLKPKEGEGGPDDMIVLATVHGAKGREANTVYVLSPKPKKGTASVFDQVWESATDRNNTLYVAVTRARLRLVFVGPMPTLARLKDEPQTDDDDYEDTAEAWELVGGSDGQAAMNGQPTLF
jgi:superfamily I DNA/RNA helicase